MSFEKHFKKLIALSIIQILLAGCSEPIFIVAGGKLAGEERQAPLEWMGVPETIQLETNPAEPYSINIWGVDIGDKLYVATGEEGTTWSGYIDEDPNVRVRVDGIVYDLTASKVEDPSERAEVLDMYVQKYEVDPEDTFVADGLIYRFE